VSSSLGRLRSAGRSRGSRPLPWGAGGRRPSLGDGRWKQPADRRAKARSLTELAKKKTSRKGSTSDPPRSTSGGERRPTRRSPGGGLGPRAFRPDRADRLTGDRGQGTGTGNMQGQGPRARPPRAPWGAGNKTQSQGPPGANHFVQFLLERCARRRDCLLSVVVVASQTRLHSPQGFEGGAK
jgi:hypothetical protein